MEITLLKTKISINVQCNAMQCNGLDRVGRGGGGGTTVAPVTNRHWGSQLPPAATIGRIKVRER